jgi:outer membrane protein insertion porin family
LPTPISLSLSGFYQQLEFVDTRGSDGDRPLYIQSAAGLNFGLTFPLAGGRNSLAAPTRLGFFYSFSPTTLEDLLAPRTPLLGDLEQSGIRTATFTPLLSYDTLERNFAAQRGRRLLLAVELSGRALGGNVNTVQPRLDFTQFIPRGRLRGAPRNFGMRVHAAHIAAYGQRFMPGTLSAVDGVPIFNRFFLGGENEVRGYQFNSIGPLARVERLLLIGNNPPALSASDLRPIGGDTQVIFNAEYGLPLRRPRRSG